MGNIQVMHGWVYINGKKARKLVTGGSREVFEGEGIIVKLDDEIWHQSSSEKKRWKGISSKDRQYFQEPIATGRGWIAQRKIRFRRGRRPRWAYRLIGELAKKYNIEDFMNWDWETEFPHFNWCMREDGTPVIYDWGV